MMKSATERLDTALADLRKHLDKASDQVFKEEATLLMTIKAMLDCKPDPAWIKLPSGIVVYINHAYTDHFDKTPEKYAGNLDNVVWEQDIADGYTENDLEVYTTGKAKLYKEWVTVKGDKQLYYILKWPVVFRGEIIAIAGESKGPVDV